MHILLFWSLKSTRFIVMCITCKRRRSKLLILQKIKIWHQKNKIVIDKRRSTDVQKPGHIPWLNETESFLIDLNLTCRIVQVFLELVHSDYWMINPYVMSIIKIRLALNYPKNKKKIKIWRNTYKNERLVRLATSLGIGPLNLFLLSRLKNLA